MPDYLGAVDYVVIGITLAVSAVIGLYLRFSKTTENTTTEFLLAGKRSSIWTVSFSLMATMLSAVTVLGEPGEVYKFGTQMLAWLFGVPAGIFFVTFTFIPVFFELDITTAYQYLDKRFGSAARTVASVLFTIYSMFYIGVIVYAPALALNAATGLSLWASVTSITVICTIYCTLGGLKAVLWTDLFQSMLIFLALIAVVVKGLMELGIKDVFTKAENGERLILFNTSLDFTERYTIWNSFAHGFFQAVFFYGTNQSQVQRILSLGSLKKAKKALLISIPLVFAVKVLCAFCGLIMYAYFQECDPISNGEIKSADQLLPYFIVKNFRQYPGLSGLCISGILAASLSSISSVMNSLPAIIVEDFMKPYCACFKLTEAKSTAVAKISGIIFGGVCLLMTYIMSNTRGVLESATIVGATLGGPMIGIFTLGLFTKRANLGGILTGLVSGFFIVGWIGVGSHLSKPKVLSLPVSTEGCEQNFYASTEWTDFNSTENYFDADRTTSVIPTNEEKYILSIYRMSYTWLRVFGWLIVCIIGYVLSCIIGIWKKQKVEDNRVLTPIVRQFCLEKKTHPEIQQIQSTDL